MLTAILEIVQSVAALATTAAVWFAWGQLKATKQQAISQFEDAIAREYREIAHSLPIAALLGDQLDAEETSSSLHEFYQYIDLTNSQVFLRQQGRITPSTWKEWRDGIQGLLSRPAFAEAWREIKFRAPNSFAELRRLEREEFRSDPKTWNG